MTITDVRIRKIATDGKMKAIVSVTFDNEFVVHDIKIIEGQNGLFIAMPSRKTPDGEFKDIGRMETQFTLFVYHRLYRLSGWAVVKFHRGCRNESVGKLRQAW